MTETISHIALQKLNGRDAQNCFQLLPGVFIESDHRDCLMIAADYLGVSKIVTNDLVEILSPRQFRWLGRADHVINSGGVKIIPEKIEKEVDRIFQTLGLENRFFISGMADPKLGSRVILVVEGDPFDNALAERIHKSLGGVLTKHETPKEILAVKHFVETETQKINRKATMEELKDKS